MIERWIYCALFIAVAFAMTYCCGSIKDEEFEAMAERECPDMLKAVDDAQALELSEADKRLVAWCREVLR
jgi:hypothetical protein